jgi:hypothetical protein
LHLWSLAVEEQFYIVLPAWLLFAWRMRWRAFPAIVAAAVFSFILSIVDSKNDPVGAFYSPLSRIWEILAGVVLAYVSEGHTLLKGPLSARGNQAKEYAKAVVRSPWWKNAAALVGLSAILFACFVFDKGVAFPGLLALIPVGGSVLLVGAGRGTFLDRYLLSRGPLVGLGLISYPLYMWHWPILVFARIVTGSLLMPPQRLQLIGISLVVAFATYWLIEKPVRRAGGRTTTLVLVAALACIGLMSSFASAFKLQPREKGAGLEQILNAALDWGYPPPPFRMILADGHRFWRQDSQVRKTTIFIGDSNVEQYAPRISELLVNNPTEYRSVMFATTGGCSPIPAVFLGAVKECRERMIQAYHLADDTDVDTVVVGASWILHIDVLANETYLNSLEELIRKLASRKRVFLILNIPTGPELDPQNMFKGSRLTDVIPAPRISTQFDLRGFLREYGPLRAELKARGSRAGAVVIDPLDFLCSGAGCPVFDARGNPLYRDASHMRPFYAKQSASFVDETIIYHQEGAGQINHGPAEQDRLPQRPSPRARESNAVD